MSLLNTLNRRQKAVSTAARKATHASDAGNIFYTTDFTGYDTTVNLPNGKYDVTLTVTNNGVSVTSTKSCTVKNFLLVAIGDSYSSGGGRTATDSTTTFSPTSASITKPARPS